jgi:hypothetical protein
MHPHLAQSTHGWQVGKAIVFKALYTPAFVVNADQKVRTQFFNAATQGGELDAAFPITGEQNQTAN